MSATNPLYEDKFCVLDKTALTLKWYYFPVATSRTLDVAAIRGIYYERPHFDWATTKSWGMTFSGAWWACNMRRQCGSDAGAERNVVVDVGERHMKGFTVCDVDAFLAAAKPLLPAGATVRDGFPFWK